MPFGAVTIMWELFTFSVRIRSQRSRGKWRKKMYIYIKMQIMFKILHIAQYNLYGWKEHVLVVTYVQFQVNSSLDWKVTSHFVSQNLQNRMSSQLLSANIKPVEYSTNFTNVAPSYKVTTFPEKPNISRRLTSLQDNQQNWQAWL